MASGKFLRERHLVQRTLSLVQVTAAEEYRDPNAGLRRETGADVLVIIGSRRMGFEVTEVDTGEVPGQSRAAEKAIARAAEHNSHGVYGTFAQKPSFQLVTHHPKEHFPQVGDSGAARF